LDSDYIYRPKKTPTEGEIRAAKELSMLPSIKSILMHLATLMAFRPIQNATANQCDLVMQDIANKITREKYSEAAVIWAIEKLKDGNSGYGGRNFPTREEIISEIISQDKKIDLLLRAFGNASGSVPPGYHRYGSLDLVFDEMDKEYGRAI